MRPGIQCDPGESEPLSDEEIVRRVRAGQQNLYQLLLRRHNQRVYRAVRAVLRDETEIEDVMQQAYVRAYLHLDQFAGLARFSTWLVRIAVHEACARARQPLRLVLCGDGDSPEAQSSIDGAARGRTPEEEAGSREIVLLVERAIDDLPEIYRTILVLREIEGLSTAEVAEALAISEEVVKTRLRRARGLLCSRVLASDNDLGEAYRFGGQRCNGMVAAVMSAIPVVTWPEDTAPSM